MAPSDLLSNSVPSTMEKPFAVYTMLMMYELRLARDWRSVLINIMIQKFGIGIYETKVYFKCVI